MIVGIEQRLARLERQNRLMKCAAVAAIGLFVTLGQAKPSDTIRARAFVLVDEAGKALGALAVRDDGHPSLVLSGDDSVAVIEFSKGGVPRLVLTDGTRQVSLANHAGGGLGLRIKSEDGMAEVMVTPAGSKVLLKTQPGPEQMMAALGATKADAMVSADSKHGSVILGTSGNVGPALVLLDPDKKIVFAAP